MKLLIKAYIISGKLDTEARELPTVKYSKKYKKNPLNRVHKIKDKKNAPNYSSPVRYSELYGWNQGKYVQG